MGTKQVRVSEDLYTRVMSKKRDDETFSDALERMIDDYDLTDFADDISGASDAWDTEALEREFEEDDRENRRALEEELP